MIDIDYNMGRIEEIKDINITIDLSDPNRMLNVECILKDKNTHPRPLVDKICELWQKELAFKNNYYKTQLDFFDSISKFKFGLSFVTWHSLYLTGKIEVKTV